LREQDWLYRKIAISKLIKPRPVPRDS
jgi:hypothetical protein